MEWETAPLLYYTKKVIRQTCYTNCDIIITSSENLFVENFGNYKLIYLSHNACFKCLIDRNKELDMNYILVLIKFGKERAMSLIEDAKIRIRMRLNSLYRHNYKECIVLQFLCCIMKKMLQMQYRKRFLNAGKKLDN